MKRSTASHSKRRSSIGNKPAQNMSNDGNASNSISRPKLPHLIWDQTSNQLNTTSSRLEAFSNTNEQYKEKLSEAEKKLLPIIARVKEIEKESLDLDWDSIKASGEVDAGGDGRLEDGRHLKVGTRAGNGKDERVLTRQDTEAQEVKKKEAAEALAGAAADAKATFEANVQRYVDDFKAKTKKRSKVPNTKVKEHDTLLEEIQTISTQQSAWEEEINSEAMQNEESWARRLAELEIDSGFPATKSPVEKIIKTPVASPAIKQGRNEPSTINNPQSQSQSGGKPKLKLRAKQNNTPKAKAVPTASSSPASSPYRPPIDQAALEETVRRSKRKRTPTAKRRASLEHESLGRNLDQE